MRFGLPCESSIRGTISDGVIWAPASKPCQLSDGRFSYEAARQRYTDWEFSSHRENAFFRRHGASFRFSLLFRRPLLGLEER